LSGNRVEEPVSSARAGNFTAFGAAFEADGREAALDATPAPAPACDFDEPSPETAAAASETPAAAFGAVPGAASPVVVAAAHCFAFTGATSDAPTFLRPNV
jgi:hypothetical protein